MRWSEAAKPVPMQRVAIIAPREALRETLVRLADAGCVEIDRSEGSRQGARGPAARRLQRLLAEPPKAALSAAPPDLDALEREGHADLLAGEAQLEEHVVSAVRRGNVVALAGWCPAAQVPATAARLVDLGGVLVPLTPPRGVDPPTLLRSSEPVHRSFTPLVRTYGTVPYVDVDPTWPAGIAYVVMFGMMFGDAGHGALLLLMALLLRSCRPRRLVRLRAMWPFVAGAGGTSMAFGFAYGEFFGPTKVLPVLWMAPLDHPERLLTAAVAVGVVLLALAYVAGIVNRWREGGPARALCAVSGIAGSALFLGLAGLAAGGYLHHTPLTLTGAVIAAGGLVLAASGLFAVSGGGVPGAMQTTIQLFDAVVRIFSNTVSFARLAAFGLTHAALGDIVWRGTTALAHAGPGGLLGAAAVFTVGNALVFSLEALVAGVQALRLEFYELFSRVFETWGRPFRPWHVSTQRTEVAP
ncbi:V-type ATPase 116kDa subunit family protein [Streptomyces sp. NBC_01618]|uniref:V-type ATPase 116kDa subunit family protein n=1 Tax=Streptomyces sp. NBC_01618 TaxID=2975900 RepID=UPI00386A1D88|nr:ATPase [Streptomyces sp. NBC_01618]